MTRNIPVLHEVQQVSEGWINKYLLTYQLPDGSLYEYESVSRKPLDTYRKELEERTAGTRQSDAVCIVPQTADGNLLLIREFRYPINNWCIAFPAGLMEPGENIASCVNRELREETGYALRCELGTSALVALPQVGLSSTGMTDESVQVVFAHVEKVHDAQPEASEFIEPFLLPFEEVPSFLTKNTMPIGTRAQLILDIFARG